MQVIHIGTEVYGGESKPATPEESRARHDAILAALNTPINLGRATKLAHDTKSDRYAVTCVPSSDKTLVVKTTDELAAFIAEHIDESGYWLGRMESGALVDANLIQAD